MADHPKQVQSLLLCNFTSLETELLMADHLQEVHGLLLWNSTSVESQGG